MKKITGLFLITIAALTFISCDPIESRQEAKGAVTDAEINQYVVIEQQVREGKKSNYFSFSVRNLKALTQFKHGLGTYVGAGTNGYIQCFVVPGQQTITAVILNADGTKTEKPYTFNIEQCFDVAPEWALFCGTGSKTWTWDVSLGANMHGMGDVNDNQAGWWCPTPEERVANEGVGASFKLTASGSSLVKTRTDGSTQTGTFGFNMTKTTGFARSMGFFTTSGATILAAINTKGGETENKFHIMRLNENELRLLVIDMDGRDSYKPDVEGWGQATHWCFRVKP